MLQCSYHNNHDPKEDKKHSGSHRDPFSTPGTLSSMWMVRFALNKISLASWLVLIFLFFRFVVRVFTTVIIIIITIHVPLIQEATTLWIDFVFIVVVLFVILVVVIIWSRGNIICLCSPLILGNFAHISFVAIAIHLFRNRRYHGNSKEEEKQIGQIAIITCHCYSARWAAHSSSIGAGVFEIGREWVSSGGTIFPTEWKCTRWLLFHYCLPCLLTFPNIVNQLH
mmetsp:Transcript_4003/g.6632  ORF Transcript_4003/g.6632 Transcript_4003/m.6632 type:complete len:225 (+) Transcript_4003:2131-2805(+)